MFGLIALGLILLWLLVSIVLVNWIARRVSREELRPLVVVMLAPVFFALPLADEIIGKFQFDRLCEKAQEINIHGTIPMGASLYLPGGEWRRSVRDNPLQENQRIDAVIDALIRYENSDRTMVPGWIPMRAHETKIFDRRDGRILASFRSFSTHGGWISRQLEKPLVVRDQCFPANSGTVSLKKMIFPFDSNKGQ